MKNNVCRKGFMRIEGGGAGQGISLSIDVPEHIYPDFVNCFNSENGEKTLSELYDEYISMSEKQKEIFQSSVYHNTDNLLNTQDIVDMIKALKQVFNGW